MLKSKKKTSKLGRNTPIYEPYEIILIVTEGTETEPNYFNSLIDDEKLSAANVAVTGKCGSDPMSVVNYAISKFQEREKDSNKERKYDRVYCLIDRDEHTNFDAAINKLHQFNNNLGRNILNPIRSYPCFEYWYISHFESTRQAFKRKGDKSPGAVCEAYLNTLWKRKFSKKYSKTSTTNYLLLKDSLQVALITSERNLRDAKNVNDLNPSTEAHVLVDYLLKIKQPKKEKRTFN